MLSGWAVAHTCSKDARSDFLADLDQGVIAEEVSNPCDKGKPSVRVGRKAKGPERV